MASEVIKLNLIPKGEMPVFHASQFDTGRLITCELYRGEDAYSVPEGYTVELHCRKVDNNIVTMTSTLINDNVVTFTSTEQLTACNGKNLCEVAILDEGYRIGTLNFILEVEIDPLKGGITSTSEIHNLETQIEDITTEIVGENYYNKTEVDDLLDAKADASSVYTKTQVDSALALKANAADVYTKSQTDTKLDLKANTEYVNAQLDVIDDALDDLAAVVAGKANSSDVYTKAQVDSSLALKANAADVYTKTQVDNALALKANAADVYTKAETDAKIEEAIEGILPVDTAGPSAIASFTTGLALPLVNCSVGITATGGNGTPDNPVPIVGYSEANINANGITYTIAFGQTVYGGVLDVTRGKLTVIYNYIADMISYNWTYDNTAKRWQAVISGMKSYPSRSTDLIAEEWSADTSAIAGDEGKMFTVGGALYCYTADNVNKPTGELVYPLATPFDIDLTPEVISAIVGTNNVYSDTNGNTTVKFKDTIQNYIDKKVST